jgi:hypothetical protein
MPRFGTKTLLAAFAVVALWMSTFAGYAAARDLRASILLLIFVASGLAAVFSRHSRRPFWCGFFAVMLMCGGNDMKTPLNRYVPNFSWPMTVRYPQPTRQGAVVQSGVIVTRQLPWQLPASVSQESQAEAFSATIAAAWTIALAILAGLIGAMIYRRNAAGSKERL